MTKKEKKALQAQLVDDKISKLLKEMNKHVEKLNQKCEKLEAENTELKDENSNLWFMLDEMKESQKWTPDHTQALQESIDNQLAIYKIMQLNKGDA